VGKLLLWLRGPCQASPPFLRHDAPHSPSVCGLSARPGAPRRRELPRPSGDPHGHGLGVNPSVPIQVKWWAVRVAGAHRPGPGWQQVNLLLTARILDRGSQPRARSAGLTHRIHRRPSASACSSRDPSPSLSGIVACFNTRVRVDRCNTRQEQPAHQLPHRRAQRGGALVVGLAAGCRAEASFSIQSHAKTSARCLWRESDLPSPTTRTRSRWQGAGCGRLGAPPSRTSSLDDTVQSPSAGWRGNVRPQFGPGQLSGWVDRSPDQGAAGARVNAWIRAFQHRQRPRSCI